MCVCVFQPKLGSWLFFLVARFFTEMKCKAGYKDRARNSAQAHIIFSLPGTSINNYTNNEVLIGKGREPQADKWTDRKINGLIDGIGVYM